MQDNEAISDTEPLAIADLETPVQRPLIHRLPLEILMRVFSHLLPVPTFASPEWMDGFTSGYQWLIVTRICRYWRRVALACCELWSIIPVGSAHPTELFLMLSKQHLISVWIGGESPPPFAEHSDWYGTEHAL